MSVMEKRLQILLDRDRYARVETEAARSGRSVAAVIREAIDFRFGDDDERRRAAAARFLAFPTDGDTEPDWSVSKKLMADELDEKLTR